MSDTKTDWDSFRVWRFKIAELAFERGVLWGNAQDTDDEHWHTLYFCGYTPEEALDKELLFFYQMRR